MLAVPRAPREQKAPTLAGKPVAEGDVQLSETKGSMGCCGVSTISESNSSMADVAEAAPGELAASGAGGAAGDAEKGMANPMSRNYSSIAE